MNLTGNGIMGYVEIPNIAVTLPIYHGTDADTLEIGIGHLLGTSLPVGGENTHTVLTAHQHFGCVFGSAGVVEKAVRTYSTGRTLG